jgi:hypothetical protein
MNIWVRKSCLHSLTLFNIHTDEIITKWQTQNLTGIKTTEKTPIVNPVFYGRPIYNSSLVKNFPDWFRHLFNYFIPEYNVLLTSISRIYLYIYMLKYILLTVITKWVIETVIIGPGRE